MRLRCAALGILWPFVIVSGMAAAPAEKINLVFILTDNQAPTTLGCYGNPDIRTPNIDRLAAEGMRFTQAFASNGVCSPTRATYLTGLIPSQHGLHCYLEPELMMGPKAYDTLAEFRTLPKILADNGYVCGLSGKWHLGDNLHPHQGFSSWTTMVHGHTVEFYDLPVIENGKVHNEPTYATKFWTDHAVRFIRQNKDRPFFLYLPYNGPYSLGGLLQHEARNRHRAFYADKPMLSFPREKMNPWLVQQQQNLNNIGAMRRLAAETSGVDDGVGEVMATLKDLGLDQRTLIVYAADQGTLVGEHGIWGMGDHTRPIGAFDGMMRVPLIFRLPGQIAPGTTSNLMVSNYDFLPTVLDLLGLGDQMATVKPTSPGRDYAPILRGGEFKWDHVVYFEFQHVRAIRTDAWKYIHRPDGPDELYDLVHDPNEKTNLHGKSQQAAVQKQLRERLDKFFNSTADPKYDLYHGGKSKSRMVSETRAKPVKKGRP